MIELKRIRRNLQISRKEGIRSKGIFSEVEEGKVFDWFEGERAMTAINYLGWSLSKVCTHLAVSCETISWRKSFFDLPRAPP